MNTQKKICIVGYPELTQNYQAAFPNSTYEVTLPLSEASVFDWNTTPFTFHALVDSCDLLILPGGGDIDPSFFHQNNTSSKNVDFILDNVQFSFLEAFVKMNKPVIGICKGMQLINVYFGGSLTQNLSDSSRRIHTYLDQDKYHEIMPVSHFPVSHRFSWLCTFPKNLIVNSAHHQSIHNLGNNLYPVHVAKDDVIESICHRTLPIVGVQWHPERLYVDGLNQLTPLTTKLFSSLLNT